jgi:hypothetical protein
MRQGRKPRQRRPEEPGVPAGDASGAQDVEPEVEAEPAPAVAADGPPEAIPEAIPEATPEVAAEVAAEVAPESALQVVPETGMIVLPTVEGGLAGQLSFESLHPESAEGDEVPDEPADLLVSVSPETLVNPTDEEVDYADEDPAAHGAFPEGWPQGTSAGEAAPYEAERLEDGAEARPAYPYADADASAPAGASLRDQPGLEMRLARIHLRTGSLFMARAELEALAAREQLDTAAHLDLAEARWRTGDLHGAGEAAAAYLGAGGGEALGFVISAEANTMANRPAEARRHAEMALQSGLSELAPVFAGLPRRAAWPAVAWATADVDAAPAGPAASAVAVSVAAAAPDAVVEGEPVAVAGDLPVTSPPAEAPVEEATEAPADEPVAPAGPVMPVEETPVEPPSGPVVPAEIVPAAEEPSLPAAPTAGAPSSDEVTHAGEGAGTEVAAGRSLLDAGDPLMAALHFGVAIRLNPASAAAVLDAIGDRQDLPLQLVRGDALRLLGQEDDAGTTYKSVASALGAARPRPPEPAEPEPAEPEPAAPEPAEPEPAAPEIAAPEPAEPEPAEPEPAAPEIAAPESAEPEAPLDDAPPAPEEPSNPTEPPELHWE